MIFEVIPCAMGNIEYLSLIYWPLYLIPSGQIFLLEIYILFIVIDIYILYKFKNLDKIFPNLFYDIA